MTSRSRFTGPLGGLAGFALLALLARGTSGCGEGLVGEPTGLDDGDGGVRQTESLKCRAMTELGCMAMYGKHRSLFTACTAGAALGAMKWSCDPYRVCRNFSAAVPAGAPASPMVACFEAVAYLKGCDHVARDAGTDTGTNNARPDAGACFSSPCGPHTGYGTDTKTCTCGSGYLNCDGRWSNGCEHQGAVCPK
ncbi:MAG: hypothetical protein IT371_19855 [Deltaproteobacteria bacterium]|nr:hypothetical protein [Deltaproteobacteria bacterium]